MGILIYDQEVFKTSRMYIIVFLPCSDLMALKIDQLKKYFSKARAMIISINLLIKPFFIFIVYLSRKFEAS